MEAKPAFGLPGSAGIGECGKVKKGRREATGNRQGIKLEATQILLLVNFGKVNGQARRGATPVSPTYAPI